MKKRIIISALSAVVLCSVLGFGMGVGIPKISDSIIQNRIDNIDTAETMENSGSTEAMRTLDEASKNTVEIIKQVKPSVACITSVVQGVDFFNQIYESEGSGSGIVFYKDNTNAYIVTNNHVIDGASRVTVSIEECDLVSASLVGKDANKDLAVISVSLADLAAAGVNNVQVAAFGNSDDVQIGETVVAIGNALGRGNTATKGIISNTAKDVNFTGKTLNVLQTDAAINPGNSGGALVNSKGQVIGINSVKIASTQVEGVGYSISINSAKDTIETLMNNTDTPALGVSVATITEDIAQQNNLPTAGVIITEIVQGGSAYNAGLQSGDIITSFNNSPVFTADQLVTAVKQCKTGDRVSITYVRDGNANTINVNLQKAASGF